MEVTTRGPGVIADRGSGVAARVRRIGVPRGASPFTQGVMTEDRCRPGSAHAGRYQEVRGGEGGERDGMDTP